MKSSEEASMKQKLVLIGNGMAGLRTIEELLKINPDLYDITVFGAEPHPNYNRIMLSPVLAGEKYFDVIVLNSGEWYEENAIELVTGDPVVNIDRVKGQVVSQKGIVREYDRLLLATGSTPFIIPVPGADKEGVIGFRDIADVETMLQSARNYKNAVVIGGGLLGLEAANGLMKNGMHVTVVHLLDTLMERQLDKPAAALLKSSLEERGLTFKMEAQTAALLGEEKVTAVQFADGSVVPADLVVMAVGIRPNIELAQQAGIYCERGIMVDDTMQTFDPLIYAVGECVQHRGTCYGLVAPLFDQAKVCANHLALYGIARYEGSVTSTKLKVTGIDLFSAGEFYETEGDETLILQDPSQGIYKKLVIRDNKIKGAVMYGDTIDGTWYFQLLREGADISDFRNTILFGQHDIGADTGDSPYIYSVPARNIHFTGCQFHLSPSQWFRSHGREPEGCENNQLWDVDGIEMVDKETKAARKKLFRKLLDKGLDASQLQLVVSDGRPGLHTAIRSVFPKTVRHQRCIFHKLDNLADNLTYKNLELDPDLPYRKARKKAKEARARAILRQAAHIYRGRDTETIRRRVTDFQRKWASVEPKAVRCFLKDFNLTLNYLRVPFPHKRLNSTTNLLEGTRVSKSDSQSWIDRKPA